MPDDSMSPIVQHGRDMRSRDHDAQQRTSVAAGSNAHAPHRAARRPRHLKLFGVLVLIAAIAAAAYGILSRRAADRNLAAWTDAQAVPTVSVAHPLTSAASRSLTLPGDVQAFYDAPIYARVSGYLQAWYKDIGARVKSGEVLATIDTPDLDQELAQARADLASARANSTLADLTAKRWHALLASNSVSQQSADEKEGNAAAARAIVNAQQAHVDRLLALTAFKKLVAPFDGVVTARNTDVGALINAGSSAVEPLFKVADIHEMRVYVRVPQAYASELAKGMKAELTQPQYPGQIFPAVLDTTSFSVTTASRTVLVELLAKNPDSKLWPGTYADVKFDLPPDRGVLRVPTSALIFRSHGAEIATIGAGDKIVMKPVSIGRNLGTEIEITAGLTPADNIITTPLDTLENGQKVVVAAAPDDTAQTRQ
ncbi:MAG TPA: efflux RND transporter periplasmic adaptor subunit [Acetobacteraceae bacterium]|nr:efflux RND transporter periplasmic adaptor subunit [Acetobacteraceae bacterium]